jgi:1,4-alpha-glucan branching enzyme
MLRSTKVKNRNAYQLTFSLPPSAPTGRVSVVGDFNDWTPGRHELKRLRDGSRAVSVRIPAGRAVRFRYLAADGQWFDDPDVLDRDGPDCVVRV